MNKINKKRLFLWSLYDFANSIVMIVFFLYYSQWLVVDRGISDLWFNITLIGSSALFLLTVPVLSSITDKLKVDMLGLRVTTIGTTVFYLITGIVSVYLADYYILSIVTFTLATYFYLFSFTFYTPLLNDIAPPEHQGLASGWGMFGDWLGQIVGLLITIPLATNFILFAGQPGRAQTFIPAVLCFFILALPMLIFFKKDQSVTNIKISVKQEYKDMFRSFIKLCALPGVGMFLLACFFYNDAVTTASNNFPIYTNKLFGTTDEATASFLIIIILTSAIGSPICGWLADRYGFKKVFLWTLGGWLILFPLMALAQNLIQYGIVCAILGLWFGATGTITRAYLIRLTPKETHNQAFTYFTLMERLATFIGPVSWSVMVIFGPTTHALNYRLAAVLMAVFVLVGFLIARKVPEPQSKLA